MGLDVKEVLALVRRYATAIAEGRIEAKTVATMSDEDLLAFDEEKFSELDAKQKEAESLIEK